jgi:hypothetical protein
MLLHDQIIRVRERWDSFVKAPDTGTMVVMAKALIDAFDSCRIGLEIANEIREGSSS